MSEDAIITVESCISWRTPNRDDVKSAPFRIQKLKSYLRFSARGFMRSNIPPTLDRSYHLYLESDCSPGEPFDLSVQLIVGKDVVSQRTENIRSSCQVIWSSNNLEMLNAVADFQQQELLFRIVLLDKKEDKLVQTPAYLDTNFEIQSLSRDLSKWLEEDGPSTDVELVCGGRTFTAHRSLLSLRSDVFGAMLRNDMTEGRTGRVQIEDVEAEIFHQFLRYLYKGTLGNVTVDTATQLYKLGDKYDVVALKRQCASFLSENLAQDNACGTLGLADRHGDRNLKEDAILFILDQKVPQDENWSDFCKEHPVLANHVLNRFCALHASCKNN